MQIKNNVALITGGNSGLGAETGRHLAKLGAKVALLDLKINQAKQIANETSGIAIVCDVTDEKSMANALQQIIAELGTPRICINCAGIAPAKKIIGRDGVMPLDDFKQVIDINLIGTFNIMRIATQAMAQAEMLDDGMRGIIINTASVAAYDGQIGQTAYSASKGAVVSMTLPAARELAQWGIRVMTIAPGIMQTPMMSGMPQNVQDSLAQQVPFPKRLGSSDEYAKLVQHIIENDYLNGSVIRLDGGIRMQPK